MLGKIAFGSLGYWQRSNTLLNVNDSDTSEIKLLIILFSVLHHSWSDVGQALFSEAIFL